MLTPISLSEFASVLTPLLPTPPPALACAVSGGADSMALALLARGWCEERGIYLLALTVDHGLRESSAREAAQVMEWMQAQRTPCITLKWSPPLLTGSAQAHAREARYRLMEETCAQEGIHHLLLGHHRDDQAETLLLRLKRGSHVRGLSGMRPASTRGSLVLLRPLLSFPKARLAATLHAMKQAWLEDPSNASPDYERNRLRRLLAALPEAEAILSALSHSAEALGRYREKEEAAMENFFAQGVNGAFPAAAFLALSGDEQALALGEWLRRTGNRPHPPRFADLNRLLEALRSGVSFRRTLHGCIVTHKCERLEITPEKKAFS